ncbi:hypothetical protein AB0C34_27870 [Nocardia sp. NPDC049220]|uniref:hypothetical protein n=1 Tax=Nocardia sp. NPDC049220 TaxID=3155273 RepID=UPI0033ED3ADC
MQGQLRFGGKIGPGKFESAVVAARIIPLSELMQIPGFTDLTPEQMWHVTHTPANMQWVSRPVHWMQRGRSAATLTGIDPDYQVEQVQLENRVRSDLHRAVSSAATGDARLLDQLEIGAPSMVSGTHNLEELLGGDRGDGPIVFMFDVPDARTTEPFHEIDTAGDREERVRLALRRWNSDFLDLVPKFASELHARLRDVHVCRWHAEGQALLYFVEDADGNTVVWVGWDPHTFTEPTPPFWETLPPAVHRFLTDVHPGFTMLDGESYGLAQPSYMSTFATWAGWLGAIPDWNREDVIGSTSMLWLTGNGFDTALCSSPELAVGEVAVLFEDQFDVSELGKELDTLMLSALRL